MELGDVMRGERSHMTADGLHIVWRDDFEVGKVRVRSGSLVEAGRGTTGQQINEAMARRSGVLMRVISWFGS